MVFKYNKFLFNKNRLYMGKGCPINGLLKMNVMTILQDFSTNNQAKLVIVFWLNGKSSLLILTNIIKVNLLLVSLV